MEQQYTPMDTAVIITHIPENRLWLADQLQTSQVVNFLSALQRFTAASTANCHALMENTDFAPLIGLILDPDVELAAISLKVLQNCVILNVLAGKKLIEVGLLSQVTEALRSQFSEVKIICTSIIAHLCFRHPDSAYEALLNDNVFARVLAFCEDIGSDPLPLGTATGYAPRHTDSSDEDDMIPPPSVTIETDPKDTVPWSTGLTLHGLETFLWALTMLCQHSDEFLRRFATAPVCLNPIIVYLKDLGPVRNQEVSLGLLNRLLHKNTALNGVFREKGGMLQQYRMTSYSSAHVIDSISLCISIDA